MSEAIAMSAIDVAIEGGMPFHVQFAGGEPTLMPKLIDAVCARLAATAAPATIAVQTNATRITDDLVRTFSRYHVQVGVSIDGPPQIHNQLRGDAAGTLAGLQRLAQAGIPTRVTTVLTAINAEYLGQLVLYLAAFDNIVGLALDPLVLKGFGRSRRDLLPTPEQVRKGISGLRTSLEWVRTHRRTPLAWREENLVRSALARPVPTARLMLPMAGLDYCHACRGESLAVAPDGSVYPCSQSAGEEGSQCGTVGDIDWDRLKTRYRGLRLADMSTGCTSCQLQGRCPDDCPSRVEANSAMDPVACVIYQAIAEREVQP